MINMKNVCLVLMLLTIALPNSAFAKEKGIMKIYGDFIIANATTAKCMKPHKTVLDGNLANLKIVQARAIDTYKTSNPNATSAEIKYYFSQLTSKYKNAAEFAVDKYGCDHELVKKG